MPARDARYQNKNNSLMKLWRKTPNLFKTPIRKALRILSIQPYLALLFNSPLRDRGWFSSCSGAPIDQHGNPLPWMPYSFIDFTSDRLRPKFRVFEYGSGNSTKWFANRVKEVRAVEHNYEWYERVNTSLPSNAEVIHRTGEEYITAIEGHGEFDIIVIDGEYRNECANIATQHLTPNGVLIWDDTFRGQYRKGMKNVAEDDFSELYFQGMGPVTENLQRTSIFYRNDNCFNI